MDTSLDVLLAEMPALVRTLPCSGEFEQEKWDEILATAADCGSDWLDNLIEAVGQEAFKQSILKQLKATYQLIKQFEAKGKDLEEEIKKGHANEELQAREIERLEVRVKELEERESILIGTAEFIKDARSQTLIESPYGNLVLCGNPLHLEDCQPVRISLIKTPPTEAEKAVSGERSAVSPEKET